MAEHAPEQNLSKLYPNPFQIYIGIDMGQGNGNKVHEFEVKTLEKFWENTETLDAIHKIDILKQLTQCLCRLHQQNVTCPQLSSSETYVLSSKLDKHVPDKKKRTNDIHLLASIYGFVLTNRIWQDFSDLTIEDIKCSDPDIALDILRVLTSKTSIPNIEDVLGHPFYWSDITKVYFICSAVELIKSKKKKNMTEDKWKSILKPYNMQVESGVIPAEGWIAALKLSRNEARHISKNNRGLQIGDDVIYKLAPKEAPEKNSVYELMNFFRNRYIHYYEDAKDTKMAFKSYPAGYLKFFTSRFPNLFMHVYRNMNKELCRKDNKEEFCSH